MTRPTKQRLHPKKDFRVTANTLRAFTFLATLVLAGVAIVMRVESPTVWTFLGMAIGASATRGGLSGN